MKTQAPEENFAIGIIGGTGGIGKWFVNFFTDAGHTVHVSGRTSGFTISEISASCKIVIVSVPIAATLDVIHEVGPLLPEDALLMDFTSLKEEPVKAMLAATRAEVIGCHPLFGPDVLSIAGQNVVLCPARGERWLGFLQELFEENGARVRLTTPSEHDRIMALIQGLTHLDTLLMGLVLRDSGAEPSELDAFSTPIFRTKQAIDAKVFGPHPGLYAGLLTENPNMPEILEIFERNFTHVKDLIQRGDASGIEALLKKP